MNNVAYVKLYKQQNKMYFAKQDTSRKLFVTFIHIYFACCKMNKIVYMLNMYKQ